MEERELLLALYDRLALVLSSEEAGLRILRLNRRLEQVCEYPRPRDLPPLDDMGHR